MGWRRILGADGGLERLKIIRISRAQAKHAPREPDVYSIGIDEGDEWAARGAIARPKLTEAAAKHEK